MICSTFAAKQPLTMEQKFGAEITGGQERYVNLLLDSRGVRGTWGIAAVIPKYLPATINLF